MHYCKIHILIIFCLAIAGGSRLQAQDARGYEQADSVSYQLYLTENWKELTLHGHKTIREGYDSYYLQVRTGIAYYMLKRYRAAIPYFKKALSFQSGDETAMNYLYLSYLYAERFEDAKSLSRKFSPSQAQLMKTVYFPAIEFISAEGGMKHSDSSGRFKDAILSSVSIGHSVARRFSLFHNLSYFGQSEARFTVQQFQYYIRANIPLKNDLLLSAGAHYFNGQISSTSTYTVPGNPPPPPPPGQPPPPAPAPRVVVETHKATSNSFVGALTLTHFGRLFNYSIGTTAASLDTAVQYQLQAGMSYFPFRNNRLSVGATVYQHTESGFQKNELAVVPFISAYVSPKLFLTFGYLTNRGNNIIEHTGYGVNNSIDRTGERYSFSASFRILKKAWVYGVYSYETKQHAVEAFTYHYHLFLIGFKIIP